MFTYSYACQAKVAESNSTIYWNVKMSTRVPRLDSSYFSNCKLQPLYFVTNSFWRRRDYDWWKLCRTHFFEVPPPHSTPKKTNFFDGQNGIWQSVEDFNIEHCMEYHISYFEKKEGRCSCFGINTCSDLLPLH